MAIPQFRIKEAKQAIEIGLATKEPTLIVGAPGIGKSDIVLQAAKAHGMGLILTHPSVGDPTDAKGFPFAKDGKADFLPYGDLRYAMETTKPTLWFLDDLGQAPPAVQAAYMQLLLAREVNGKRISDSVVFVAATNGRQHKAGVTGILEPVKSRFAMIFELVAHIDDFCEWAYKTNIYPSIPAFLRFDSKQLHDFQTNRDMEQSPCPRTWAKLSKTLYTLDAVKSPLPRQKVVASHIGEGASIPFCTFEKVFGNLPDIDMIIRYPDTFQAPRKPDELYAIAASLSRRASLLTIDGIVRCLEKMPNQYAAFAMQDARSICPDIDMSDAYGRYSERLSKALIGNI